MNATCSGFFNEPHCAARARRSQVPQSDVHATGVSARGFGTGMSLGILEQGDSNHSTMCQILRGEEENLLHFDEAVDSVLALPLASSTVTAPAPVLVLVQ